MARPKPSTARVRKSFVFDERVQEMVEFIQQEKGYGSETMVVTQAIIAMYDKIIGPAYAQRNPTKAKREADATMSANVKAQSICSALGGRIEEDKNGEKVCTFFTYTYKNRFEQSLPLDSLTDSLIPTQYEPDKETVKQLQANGEVNY